MSFNVDAIRIVTNPFVNIIFQLNSYKAVCGLQNIHKLFCGSWFSFQCPQSDVSVCSVDKKGGCFQ